VIDMSIPIYEGPVRFNELQRKVESGGLERVVLHPDPFHGLPEGPHVDVKTWLPGARAPVSFKVRDVPLARGMDGDITLCR